MAQATAIGARAPFGSEAAGPPADLERRFDLPLVASGVGSVVLIVLCACAIWRPNLLSAEQLTFGFLLACGAPLFASWRNAVLEGRLPPTPNGQPRHDHITGWSFLSLALAIWIIVALALWATADIRANRRIQADWGIVVVFGLGVAFAIAAAAPSLVNFLAPRGIVQRFGVLARATNAAVRPFGLFLSALDSILVFAVATAAGATQHKPIYRYALLVGVLAPSSMLGYWLAPPWGLIPIAWAFIVTLAISRRWAWIEDDRAIYMLNKRYTGSHIRIGFHQDLRDEALLSFMSMFLLVPLALRQVHEGFGASFFTVPSGAQITLWDWIGYYGTELAKAVPFVDWAEIYQVEGAARIQADTPAARHIVFATRVLIDLVFLAALLQALSISARNAKQMELFRAGTLDRLDPFIEPREFRKMVRRDGGKWILDEKSMGDFPKYDAVRLAELSDPSHHPISIAAIALRRRDKTDDIALFHERLLERAFQKNKDPDSVDEVLNAIRMTGGAVQSDLLDHARNALIGLRSMTKVREKIVAMIAQAADGPDRSAALKSALKDGAASVRRVALRAIAKMALGGDPDAVSAIDRVSTTDSSGPLRQQAADTLATIRASGFSR